VGKKYLLALLPLFFAANASSAAEVSFDDLVGRWCGEITDYKFSKDTLDVTFHKGGSKMLKIAKVTVRNDQSINIDWVGERADATTNNTIFRLEGDRTLIQLPNVDDSGKPEGDKGPRREFHRCK
jgi:hypothetical protein